MVPRGASGRSGTARSLKNDRTATRLKSGIGAGIPVLGESPFAARCPGQGGGHSWQNREECAPGRILSEISTGRASALRGVLASFDAYACREAGRVAHNTFRTASPPW